MEEPPAARHACTSRPSSAARQRGGYSLATNRTAPLLDEGSSVLASLSEKKRKPHARQSLSSPCMAMHARSTGSNGGCSWVENDDGAAAGLPSLVG
ncbi:hypothetical protein Dimus_005201 [Dionaea muscipula]